MRLVLVTACALTLGPTAGPQALQSRARTDVTEAAPVSSTVVEAIQAAAGRVNAALEQRNRLALDGLLTASFTWVHAGDGRVDAREEWLASAARGVALAGQRGVRSGPSLGRRGPLRVLPEWPDSADLPRVSH